jgi:hypothetical protein
MKWHLSVLFRTAKGLQLCKTLAAKKAMDGGGRGGADLPWIGPRLREVEIVHLGKYLKKRRKKD